MVGQCRGAYVCRGWASGGGDGENASEADQAGGYQILVWFSDEVLLQRIVDIAIRIVVLRPASVSLHAPVVPARKDEGDERLPRQDSTLHVPQCLMQYFHAHTYGADQDEEVDPQFAQTGRVSHVFRARRRLSRPMGLPDFFQRQRMVLLPLTCPSVGPGEKASHANHREGGAGEEENAG